MHVGLVIHMFNRSSGTLKGFSSIVSDFKMLVGLHDFADALSLKQLDFLKFGSHIDDKIEGDFSGLLRGFVFIV